MGANGMLAPLLWFAAIVAAIPLALWLLKRTPIGGGAGSQAGVVRSVGVLALAPNQRIVTVEIGRGESRRWLVLGVTPQGISTLHEMAPQPDAPAPGAPAAGFAQALAQWRRPGSDDAH